MILWYCTNEQFTVREYILANCDYPGQCEGEIERLEETENGVVMVERVVPADKSTSFHVVSFLKLKDDKTIEMDEY